LIASAERIAVENKRFRGLATKNGSYRKVPRDLVSRMAFMRFSPFFIFNPSWAYFTNEIDKQLLSVKKDEWNNNEERDDVIRHQKK